MYLPERAFRNQAERVRVPVISLGGRGFSYPLRSRQEVPTPNGDPSRLASGLAPRTQTLTHANRSLPFMQVVVHDRES